MSQKHLPAVARGRAVITGDELRCNRLRQDDPSRACRKLIAKVNQYGQLAGNFLCERCKEEIEVRLVLRQAASDAVSPTRFLETHDFPREVSPV